MRRLLIGGSILLLYGCTSSPTEPRPLVIRDTAKAHNLGDPCTTADGRTGYFVRSGDKLVCEAAP